MVLAVWLITPGLFSQTVGITGDSTINQCETKTYTISILNNSGNPLTNLVITALLENFTGFSYVNGTTSIDVPGGCTADPTISGGYSGTCLPAPSPPYLTWDIDALCGGPFTLLNNNTLNLTFSLATDCTAVSGSLNTYIDYRMSGTPFCDDTGAHSIQVLPGGVTIKKTPNVIPQELWQNVTWTLTIENTGFGIIENVVVTDVLGAGLAYVSSSPAGVNAGQTTTWDAGQVAGFASMNPGDIITIDITATVIACEFLENYADVRWGCDMVTDCYNTADTIPPSTATASVQRIVKTPLLEYTPPNVSFNYCEDYVDVNFTITNIGDGRAHDVWLYADFGSLAVSNISAGAIYNNIDKRFELTNPLAAAPGPGNTYDLSFRLTFNTWCGGGFPSGDLLWITVYKDDCDNEFYPPVKLSTINPPADSSSLSVGKTGAPSAIQIGGQIIYNITSSYSGPLSCGSGPGTTSDITVVDTIPDGFSVVDNGGGTYVPGGGGTGGTITWTYTPPASLNTSITIQVPPATECETYCFTTFTNSIQATGTDCCGCALSANASQTTAIECEELVDSEKTAVPTTGIRCDTIQYTNTYVFADNAALDTVDLSQLIFREDADNEQEYDPGSLAVTLSGSGDITACALSGLTDTTPGAGGNLIINFSNCNTYGSVRNRTLTITYRLTITEATVGACSGATFYSWSALDLNLITGSECLPDGIIYETTVVSVDPPAMSLSITGLGQIVHKCETQSITITLTQTSGTADPKDVRLVLSGLNYYVVDPGATNCSGAVAPTSCTPALVGDDYVWYFADGFTGSGQDAVLQLQVQKRCTGSGDLVATAYFDDNCNDDGNYDDTCSVTATETPALLLSGDLLIEKNPEVVYASVNTIQWKIYLTNRGSGTAYNVWFDDELGSGLDYVSAVVDNMTGVTVTADQDHNGNPINGCTIAIDQMAAGERREITFNALLIDCNNLTNDVSTSWGCVGVECQTVVTDSATVEIPRPLLINTNVVTTPADACSDPDGSIALRNAGQTTCYNLQITENLPAGLNYIPGSTRWRLNGAPWNGPNAAYDPVVSGSPEQLDWSSAQIAGLAVSNPGDTIEIEYDMQADCPFTGGNVTVGTSYENPCGQVFNTANSVFTVAFREPDVTITKTRVNEPIDCGQLVEWTIVITNNSGYTLPIIWVEDILDAAFTYQSSVGDPPFTSDNGTFDGSNTVTWELRNVNHTDTVTLTLRANSDSSPCSPDLDNTVTAYWGCGAADGSSATKPGVDAPDDTLCLFATGVTDVRTETREPTMGFLSIALNPVTIDACDDRSDLTVTIENTGPTDATQVDLVITLPDGLSYNSTVQPTVDCGSGAVNINPVVSGPTNNILTFRDIADNAAGKADNLCDTVTAGSTAILTFSVESNCYVSADLDFELYYYDCCDDTRYSTTDNETLDALYPDIDITKTPTLTQVDCAANVTWTITVTNNGSGNAEVVRIEDTLGDWLDYVPGSFTSSVPGLNIFNIAGQTYGWEFNDLGPGDTETFTIQATLNPDGFPTQADCTAALRQNNVEVFWGCGTNADSTDNDPTTTAYTCEYPTTATAGPVTLEMPNLVITGINPTITCNADGSFSGSVTVTVQNQGDGDSTPTFTVSLDDGKGWSGTGTHNGTINNGNSVDVTINTGTWAPDCHACAAPYSFTATVDTGNAVCECDESDNDFGPYSYTAPIPDLTITDIDFSNVSCTNDNISGTVDVIIRNNACVAATNFEVSLTTDGCLSFSNETVASLAAETSTTVSFTISGSWADCTVGNCQFTAVVDPTDAVCECDGTNNDRVETYSTTLPDLIVTDIDFSNITCFADNFSGFVSVTVQNRGFGSAVGFQVSLSTDGCFTFGNQTVLVPVGAGASTTVQFPITPPWVDCTDCTCQFTAAVDPTNVICECDGTNNQYTESYTQNLPDLRVNSVVPAVTCVSDGNLQGTVTVNVENIGCGNANNAVVRLLSSCGLVFADQTVNLAASASANLTFNFTPDCTACSCFFIAFIDPDSLICECSGANNILSSLPFTVNVPDITVQSDTLAINCTGSEQVTVSGTVTLANPGCGLIFNASIPMRFTLYDNTGCGGNVLDQWTQNFSPAIILPGGGTQAFAITPRTINTNLCDNSTGCQVSIFVEADYSNTICECDGTNNTYCADNKNVDIPDLEVSGDTLGVTCFDDGQVTISGNVTMVNNGCGSNLTDNIPVRFTLFDNTGCGGSVLNQWTQTFAAVNIPSGGGTQVFAITPQIVTSNLVTNSTGCQVSLRVEADYTNIICECDDTDNTYCANNKAVNIPDLQVSANGLGISCLADGQATVSGTVTMANNGCGANLAANIPVRFTLFNNINCTGSQVSQWTETLAAVNIPAGGGTQVFTITPRNITANLCTNSTGCQVSMRVEADYTGTICESSGTNNTLCSNKTVSIPDLTVNSVTPSFTCVSDGNLQGTVTVNISNIGCGDANGAVVRLTSDCGVVFADQVINLTAGSSIDVIFNYTPNCGACTCTFTAAVDPDTALCECDGTNNTLTSAPFTITVPDVEVQSDTLAVTCAGDNQVTLSGSVTLVNNGCGANLTADIPVRFTLFDNTGCGGNPINQWTQTFTAVNIASGGGTQVFTITPQTINTDLCTNSTNCQVSVRVEADYNNSICECDGTDNTYCADNKAVDIPDLQVQSDTLGVSCTSDGQVSISGTVTMANTGCGANLAADIPVRFTLFDNTGCTGNQLLQWTQTFTGVNIASGGGTQAFTITLQNLTTNLVNNSSNCRVSILIEPDYTDTICECDGTNNYCADNKLVDIPDIEVQAEALNITCTDDGQYTVTGTVTLVNTGCGSNLAANVPVRFTLHDNTGDGCSGALIEQWTETFTGVNIAPGAAQTFTITPHNAADHLCSYSIQCHITLLVEADYNNTICESDGTDNTLCNNKTLNIPELTINSVASTVICNTDGSLTGTTVNVSNTGCGNATGVVVRLTSDCGLTFADQTVNLAAGETREVFFPFTAGIVSCTCNFTAVIDPDNTICECSGSNNTRSSTQDMLIPDLEVRDETLVVTCLDDGVIRVSGTVTLINNGCGPDFTGNIPMRFTLFNRPGCGGSPVNQWTQTITGVSIASAGGTRTFAIQPHDITTNFCTNSSNCQVSILIEADYTNSICEWDGTDNTYCTNKTSDCLDLEASSVTANTNCAEDADLNGTIAVTVRNSGGNSITRDFSIRVEDGQGWSSELRYHADLGGTLPLPAGASSTVTFNWTRVFANETCQYSNITAQVDSQNEICQCTTENDTTSTSYQMPLPNLKPTAITPGCSTDGNYLVRVTIENNGCSDAGSFTVHLEDNLGHSMDITAASLAKGASTTVEFNEWPASCEPASITFTATVDANNDVCEITGSDNTMELVYTNTSPDLVITGVKPSAACRAPGDISGIFEITLQNNGNGAAGQDFKIIIDDGEGWNTEQFYQADLGGTLPIAAGETVTLRINWNRDFTKEPFRCNFSNIMVGLDVQISVCECATGNNEMMVTYRLPYPDLVLQSLLPMCSEDGQRQLQLTIGNNGCEDQKEDFNVTFSDNRGGTRTASFTAMGGTLPLRKGSPQTVTLAQWEFDCTAATTDYTAAIAFDAGGCDLLDTNNTLTLTHTMDEPDLLFGDIQWTCNADSSITFTVTVANNGAGDASGVPVHIYDGNGNLVYNQTIDVPKGTQKQFTFTCGFFPQDQNLTFRFVVDETDNYCECDGSNNEKSISFVCPSGGEEPPLKISKSCPPGQQPGGLFRFEIHVENTGEPDLTNARIEDFLPAGFQYVSGSSSLSGQSLPDPQINDRLTWTIGTLKGGETMTLVFSAVADADIDPGRYCNETQAVAALYGDVVTVTSEKVQCCTVVVRQAGAGCCLKVEEWALEPGQIPDGPLSFIEPYFHTESAMFTIYSIFNLWKDMELEKGTMPLFMKERLHNYARSTIEEFYLDSRLGLTQPDGTLWLSYAGAYPEREHSWVRKQVDETMTASQIGFELLALDKALKIEERREIQQKLKEIIDKKLTFLAIFIDNLPHAWEIRKDKVKVEVVDAIEKYVNRKDDKATLYDAVSLYLAMVELKNSGYSNTNIENFEEKLRDMLKNIDNREFDDKNLRAEFLFTLALLQAGENEQAKAKIKEFENNLATEDTEEKLATKIHEDTQREVLDNLHDYALAAAVDYKAGGTLYKELMKKMKEKYYLKDTGVFAEKQPDFTFKLSLHSLAPVILAFDIKEPEQQQSSATILYRTFDEVGLFLKKRNLSVGKPLYSLLKNYPFTEPLLPVLNFTKANQDIAPVFSKDAVIHSTQLKPIGEILIPQTFSKILSPAYETSASRIAAVSFALQYFGRKLMEKDPWVIKEEGRSFNETGKTYVDSLLKSGAGIQYKGKTLLPFDAVAIKGPKQGEHNLEPLNAGTGAEISTETLANYLLAEKLYVQGSGKYADTVVQIMAYQDQVVKQFKDTGYLPEKFSIFIESDTEKISVIPSKTGASKLTAAKLFHVLSKDDNHAFLESALQQTQEKLMPEDLIFLAAVPEMVPYFEKEIQTLVDYKDSKVSYNAADIVGRRLLGDKPDKIRESLENLKKHWDKEAVLPKSDLIENIERGLIYHHEPQQLLLYLLATHEVMDFRFERTLNFFTYLLENEWGVAWNSFITLPSARFQVFREEPKEHVEPGDLLTFRVRVDNTCPEGFGSAHDLPSLYLKAAFTPSLIYAGTQRVDGLDVLGDFQWRYSGLGEGSVLEYIYQALVPKDFSTNFIDGWIYAGGRRGFEEFGPESALGDECEDIHQVGRLNFIPFQEIQGLVFEDVNVNGIKDVGERGIPNIFIKDTRGRLFRSDGEGRFTVLAGDEHEGIQVELKSIPANYLLISKPTQLVNRNYIGEIYFGLIPCKTVTGFVYVDENQNGAYDEGEVRPEGVLLKAKDKEVITGKDGKFIFRNLPELWQQWIEVKQEQLYYKGSKENLRFNIDSKK